MVNRLTCLAVYVVLIAGAARAVAQPLRFDATLRIDLYHIGDQRSERFAIDELRVEGPWSGSRTQLIDKTDYGTTVAEIYTLGPRAQLIFSQGYCSLFGEWRTTSEAQQRERVFGETIRLPMPRERIRLVVATRNRKNQWMAAFSTTLDVSSSAVSAEHRRGGLRVNRLHGHGAPESSLDIVLLGDGYQPWQMDKFRQDGQRFVEVLLSAAPFTRYRDRINVWAVESPSRESGVDEPRKGIFRDTALSMGFNTFDSERYLMTSDNKAVRDIAANAPYDAVYIVSNTSRYGGGGIYGLYASFISDNAYDEYVFIHEFGHSFAGLADEYYTSKVAYNDMYPRGVEPWEPNITAQHARAQVKWREQIASPTPVPCTAEEHRCAGQVSLFEGAGYSAKGLYRPFVDCKMFDKGRRPFCPVCLQAVSQAIERYLH